MRLTGKQAASERLKSGHIQTRSSRNGGSHAPRERFFDWRLSARSFAKGPCGWTFRLLVRHCSTGDCAHIHGMARFRASLHLDAGRPPPRAAIFPLGILLLMFATSAASQRAAAGAKKNEDPFLPEHPRTPWRLCDPEFSHWGLWRADLGRFPPAIDGFRHRPRVKAFIRTALADWSSRTARGGGVVRAVKEVPPVLSGFGDGPKGWKVFIVAFEHGGSGWFRFGAAGWSFNSVREPSDVVLTDFLPENAVRAKVAPAPEPESSWHPEPLWDRWLDG